MTELAIQEDRDPSSTTDRDVASGRRYRLEHLSMPVVLGDMSFGTDDLGPGDRIPDFDLPTLDEGRFRSADLTETGLALLVFGSYTCPVTESAAPGLNQLHAGFGGQVRFVMVNVLEAHPGKNVPQPQTMDQKTAHAEQSCPLITSIVWLFLIFPRDITMYIVLISADTRPACVRMGWLF